MNKEHEEIQSESDIIRGDVLESIFCHVPLIHLVPVCHLSKSWNRALFSSLRHFNKPKPWLIVHSQTSRPPYTTAASSVAYDPRSNLWLRINHDPPVEYVSDLRSSNSTLLYMLSISKFSFSFDPLHLTWHQADPPLVWRTDPVVGILDRHDPLSVEIYDLETRKWDTCESISAIFEHSAASMIWLGPFDLRHDPNIYFSVIGISRDNLIMLGLLGNSENVKDIKIWELKGESFELFKEIGAMPKELVEKLKEEHASLSSIKISLTGDVLYIFNPEEPKELVVCEIDGRRRVSRWGSLKNSMVNDGGRVTERAVLTCADVSLGDLRKAMKSGKGSFSTVNNGILQ
ncbi:hypothetical protein ES332_A05G352300v1 [Gossypium tomentosum]|uniref:F-box domain-containing protein n=1 Tax=Gossypium tomentosum TaxID=34277 RepID=A0A5D2QMY0_GOSTO|nr:hypothetical protein ES332_A05G352300v1 [Gossypium tomentosum]